MGHEVLVSILESRNLSQSALIQRCLTSTLQVGSETHKGQHVEVEETRFLAASSDSHLIVTLTNCQTQTVMYVRNVPLRLVSSSQCTVSCWVAVYAPGDPRNLHPFEDEGPPRQDAPQIHVRLQHAGGAASPGRGASAEVDRLRSTFEKLEEDLANERHRAIVEAARPSVDMRALAPTHDARASMEILERDSILIAAKGDSIKTKVGAFADSARQAQSAEKQLQDVLREIDDMRVRLGRAEEELVAMSARRNEVEQDKQDARGSWARLQESLRQRDVSIMEVRNSRDESDRQLAQALEQERRQRVNTASAEQQLQDESQAQYAELGRFRSEADELDEKLRRSNERVRELEEQEDRIRSASSQAEAGGAEERALRQQLDAAAVELAAVQQQAHDQASQLAQVENNCRLTSRLLGEKEAAVEERRQESRQRSAVLRSEVDAVSRDLSMRAARVAQLEGSVEENRKQVRDLQDMADRLDRECKRYGDSREQLEGTISGLQAQLQASQGDLDCTQRSSVATEEGTAALRLKAEEVRRKGAEVEAERRAREWTQRHAVDELDSTKRAVDSEVRGVQSQLSEIEARWQILEREATSVDAEAGARELACQETTRLESAAQRELDDAAAARAAREQECREAAAKLAELETELEEARKQLRAADDGAAGLRTRVEAEQGASKGQAQALQAQLDQLNGELSGQRAEAKRQEERQAAAASSLDESRRLLPEKQTQAKMLDAAQATLQASQQRIRTTISATKQDIQRQEADLAALRARLREGQSEMSAANSDLTTSSTKKDELLRTMESKRVDYVERAKSSKCDIFDTAERRRDTGAEIRRLQEELEKMASDQAVHAAVCAEAKKQLEDLRGAAAGSGDVEEQLRHAESEQAAYEAQEVEMRRASVELERQLAELEAENEREFGELTDLEATQVVQQKRLSSVQDELAQSRDLMASATSARTLKAADKEELRSRASVAEKHVEELRAHLAAAQAAAERMERLRGECASASEALHGRLRDSSALLTERNEELEQTLGSLRASSETLEQREEELKQRLGGIEQLEREVKGLAGKVEELGGCSETPRYRSYVAGDQGEQRRLELMREVEAAEAAGRAAADQVAEREAAFDKLEAELRELEASRGRLEASSAESAQRLRSAQEEAESQERRVGELGEELRMAEESAARLPEQNRRVDETLRDFQAQRGRHEEAVQEAAAASAAVSTAEEELRDARQRLQDIRRERDELAGCVQQAERDLLGIREAAAAEAAATPSALKLPTEGEKAAALEADEQMLRLLIEQLKSRELALERFHADEHEARVLQGDLEAEMEQIQVQLRETKDKLSYQLEHGSLQFCSIEQLQTDIRQLEDDAGLLTLGLHDAEQTSDSLQKENYLMRQQVEGLYQGTLRDWAEEVHRLKLAAEIQRHRDELGHWKQAAEDGERELHREVCHTQEAHEDTEAALRRKVEILSEELPTWLEKRDTVSGQKEDRKVVGNVHSAPAALHGLIGLTREIPPDLHRRALVIGCNYARSHAPLQGSTNDAWNMLSTLRQSYQYKEDQVRCLIDGSATCPTPLQRQPTKANIMESLKWLTKNVKSGDNLLLYFGGYGSQLPVAGPPDLYEAHLLPCDFGKDLPKDFFEEAAAGRGGGWCPGTYRTISMGYILTMLHGLPAGCKVTVLLDCGHSVMPGVRAAEGFDLEVSAVSFGRVTLEPALPPLDTPRPGVGEGPSRWFRPRALELPPLPMPATPVPSGPLACLCHCYAACEAQQWCSELAIEGCVQGAFTWAFVKALTVGHLDIAVRMHSKALRKILGDLQQHFRWLEQAPLIQLSPSASLQDAVFLP